MPEAALSDMPAPSTLTIKVQTRHQKECPHRENLYSKKCNCRKQLYIYENGRHRTESAKTRSWAEAERRAREVMGEYDPVRIQARLLEQERARLLAVEEQKRAEAQAQRVPIVTALADWLAGRKPKSRSRAVQLQTFANKLNNWAQEKKLTLLDEVQPAMLYAWHGQMSKKAENRRDRLAPSSQSIFVADLHNFFKWAVLVDYLVKDPSLIVKKQKFERTQTRVLHSDAQFREILSATYQMDANRYKPQYTPEYGRDLRAIFLLQRWTGLRLVDACALEQSAIRRCPLTGRTLMTLITKKTGKLIKDRPLPTEVVEALSAIPRRQPHVRPGYYFWSEGTDVRNLTVQWTERIRNDIRPYLSLTDEEGKPLVFHSHMLRDTFAVELLLKDVDIHEVSELLTHDSILVTEKYYAPWINKRREKLHNNMVAAMERMGAVFTPASVPLPTAPQRLM